MKTHTHHDTFVLDRHFQHPPQRVFSAFSTAEQKMKWFSGPEGWKADVRDFNFKVGGYERVTGTMPDGKTTDFRCTYFDIVPDTRIVYVYDMHAIGDWLSTSLVTIALTAKGAGTDLTMTEQGVYYRAAAVADAAGRKQGTQWLLERIERELSR